MARTGRTGTVPSEVEEGASPFCSLAPRGLNCIPPVLPGAQHGARAGECGAALSGLLPPSAEESGEAAAASLVFYLPGSFTPLLRIRGWLLNQQKGVERRTVRENRRRTRVHRVSGPAIRGL